MWDLVAGAQGNITTTFSWEPQPMRRGTFSIIATCFVTLALCTWKIVHLNLPGVCPDADLPYSAWWTRGTTRSMRHRLIHIFGGHQITRQIGWLLIGLFAPETIAFAAFEQYWDARSLQRYMEGVYLQQPQKPGSWSAMFSHNRDATTDVECDDADKPVWTMTHSWYAIMGGYCYNLREGSKVYLPDDHGREKLALRDEALQFVAQHEPSIIPKLSVNSIMDKSSAGAFVKVITLFQALWFSLQCIARMGQGLSISLLELTTFAHCIVGLIIGWLWLQKPLDISEADALDIPDGVKEPHWMMAMLYTLSSFDGESSDDDACRKLSPQKRRQIMAADPEPVTEGNDTSRQVYLDPLGEHAPLSFSDLNLNMASSTRPSSSRPATGRNTRAGSLARPPSSRPVTGASHLRPQAAPRSPTSSNSPPQSLSEMIQAAADAECRLKIRMQLAQKGWNHYIFQPGQPAHGATEAGGHATGIDIEHEQIQQATQRRLKRTLQNTLVDRITNFPRGRHYQPGDPLHKEHTIRTHLGITLTGFLYGGLHLLAWDASFMSPTESTIWKVAALSLAASGLLVPVTHAEGVISGVVRPWLEMDEGERDAEEAAHLAEKARTMSPWRGGWRRYWWKFYKWCFLWMVEVIRVLKVVVMVILAIVYFGLRIFIFLECLINLGHLPPSAYDVVRWSQYVPHIS